MVEQRQPEWFKLVDEFMLSLVQGYAQVLSIPIQGFRDHRFTVFR
jgi:hypothetical protein